MVILNFQLSIFNLSEFYLEILRRFSFSFLLCRSFRCGSIGLVLLGLVNELYGLGQSVYEIAEILTVEENLMLLKTYLLVIALAADYFLALRDGQIHLILAGLAHIHVVDAFACLDGMREYHILLNIIGRLLPEILHKI